MPKAAPIQTSFNRGIFSSIMDGHINLRARTDAYKDSLNLIALIQGPVTRRGGTRFAFEVKDSSVKTALVPFEFNDIQAYQIEFSHECIRFYRNHGIITEADKTITGATAADPVVITATAHGYSNGDEVIITGITGMTELNGRNFIVANKTTDTFGLTDRDGNDIDGSAFTAYSSGGIANKVYEISSPYQEEDLFDENGIFQIGFTQSADVLFLTHPKYKERSLTRTGHASWTLAQMTREDGPYLPINLLDTALTASAATGSVTVTAGATAGINNGQGFLATDVGRHLRFKNAGNWAWGIITAHTSSTEVTVEVKNGNFPTVGTGEWRIGLFSDTTGYPSAVFIYEDRVVLSGPPSYPQRFDATMTGGFDDTKLIFSPTDPDGTVNPDNALTGITSAGKVNNVTWIAGDEKGLLNGTIGGEWITRATTNNEALEPSNSVARQTSFRGSAKIQPVQAGNSTLFVQRARRKLHDYRYFFEKDGHRAIDLNLFAPDVTRTGINGLAYQKEPISVVWAGLTNGKLLGLTFEQDQEITAWHRHQIGGYSDEAKTTHAKVESLSVIPSPDGEREELWLIVQRYIDGGTKRYVEYMERYFEDDMEEEEAFHVDCGLTYSGSATGTITNLHHLEGEEVMLLVDGKSHPDKTVEDGQITLSSGITGSKIHVGLKNAWHLHTLKLEAGSANGTAQGKIKRITKVTVRMLKSLALRYGKPGGTLDEESFDNAAMFDQPTPFFTGDIELPWPEGSDTAAEMYFTHDGPFPMTIQALMPDVETQDK
jgi:hypothetical protein